MNAAAEKEPVFGTDEGEGLNVGRKNEFLEGKMGQTEGNVGCPESESIASERDRLRTMEMAGQLECGGKRGETATIEAGLGEAGLKSDIWRETAKIGQVERELGCRGSPPAAVADAEEVLAALTRILRGEEEAKTSEVLRAAELLGKQYGLFGDREGAPTEAPKIVMDVPGRGEKK